MFMNCAHILWFMLYGIFEDFFQVQVSLSHPMCTILCLQTPQNQDNAELFVNCLEAMVETCLPGDDLDVQNPYPSSLGIASALNLSSSMSSISLGTYTAFPFQMNSCTF